MQGDSVRAAAMVEASVIRWRYPGWAHRSNWTRSAANEEVSATRQGVKERPSKGPPKNDAVNDRRVANFTSVLQQGGEQSHEGDLPHNTPVIPHTF